MASGYWRFTSAMAWSGHAWTAKIAVRIRSARPAHGGHLLLRRPRVNSLRSDAVAA